MTLHYNFNTLYDKEISVNCSFDYNVDDNIIDKNKYESNLEYKNYIDDKYYMEALETCVYDNLYELWR